jgi:hypothetical protein
MYRGVAFKLVQNRSRRYADHLLSIVETEEERRRAFAIAAEFISAVAWTNRTRMAVWDCGYMTWQREDLRKARPNMHDFRVVNFSGNVVGATIDSLPFVETPDQRKGLALFREARASNNEFVRFLFAWQVMDLGGTNARDYANKVVRKSSNNLHFHLEDDIAELHLGARKPWRLPSR